MSTNKSTEYTVQKLENWSSDQTVEPIILRRGIVSKDTNGEYHDVVNPNDKTDSNNSTETPLLASDVFTGTATDTFGYKYYVATVHSDVVGTLKVQYSPNGTDWHDGEEYSVPANVFKPYTPPIWDRYIRLIYTNGGTDQTTFHLHATLRNGAIKDSSHNINDNLNDDDDAPLRVTVSKLRTAQNTYVSQTATASGNAKVSLEEYNGDVALYGLPVRDPLSEVVLGNVTGRSPVNKFGASPDFDTGDSEVTMWDGAEDGAVWELMKYVYSTGANIDSISSTNNGDTQDVEVQGLDANYDLVIQTVTLQGNTRVALTTSLIRVFRVKNSNSTDFAGHIIVYENDTTVDDPGVPDDSNLIRAVVHPENNQTEMCVFTVPAGYTALVYRFYADTAGASRSAEYLIKLKARPFGGVWQLKQKGVMDDSTGKKLDREFKVPLKFSEKTDIELTAEILTSNITGANLIGGFDIVLVEN